VYCITFPGIKLITCWVKYNWRQTDKYFIYRPHAIGNLLTGRLSSKIWHDEIKFRKLNMNTIMKKLSVYTYDPQPVITVEGL